MINKDVFIAALTVVTLVQTHRARFYRKDAKRLSDTAKAMHGVLTEVQPVLEQAFQAEVDKMFDQMTGDL